MTKLAPTRFALHAAAYALLAVVTAVAVGEWLGWPFLKAPVERLLSERLERRVLLSGGAAGESPFRVRFIGGLRLSATHLEVAAPTWSSAPHLLRARDVELELGYADLWRAHGGQRLRIQRLQAKALDAQLERQADGRASWQLGRVPANAPLEPLQLPQWGSLQVGSGTVLYRDVPLAIDVQAQLSLPGDGSTVPLMPGPRLHVRINGQVRQMPVKIEAAAYGVLPWVAGDVPTEAVPVSVQAQVGRAEFSFLGTATDPTTLAGLAGRFSLKGPSLAAVGDAIGGVTLPTTAAFHMDGLVRVEGDIWEAVVTQAAIGSSRLSGAFVYEAARHPPLLSGRLRGSRLMLVDLGPVVGTTAAVPAAAVGTGREIQPDKAAGKVLPNRKFDLPSLRAMDANVLIDIANVDLHSSYLEPLQPLRGHLRLAGGVLRLSDLDARTAQGQFKGELGLDGRGALALWTAKLQWDGVRLERWIRQVRPNGAPPYVSGKLKGQASLAGQGRSTAEILASLKGQVRTELLGGSISHLVIEVAGLDLAQSLGVMFKGDDALPVSCAVADFAADQGLLRSRLMVLDTSDSTVWVDGNLSMVSEQLDLRAVVSPKDKSPLALRAPLRVGGSFASPQVSVEKGALGGKLALAALLALVNPVAAVLPLIDLGDAEEAARGSRGCKGLSQRQPPARAVKIAPASVR